MGLESIERSHFIARGMNTGRTHDDENDDRARVMANDAASSDEARAKARGMELEHELRALARKYEELRSERDEAMRRERDAHEDERKAQEVAREANERERVANEEAKMKSSGLEARTRERDEARARERDALDVNGRYEREMEGMKISMEGYVGALEGALRGKNEAEAEARAATGRASVALAENVKLESEVKVLSEHNSWLKEQLEVKSTEALAAKKAASAEVLKLAQELEATQSAGSTQQRELARVKERAATSEARVTLLEEELKVVRFDLARNESDFDKEVAKAQRIAEVSKAQVRERDEQIKELENTLRTAESTLAGKKTEFAVALAEAKHAKEAALKELEEVKSTASVAAAAPTEPSHRIPNADLLMAMSPAAGAVALRREGLSMTELYTKYAESEDALRLERAQRSELQGHLDAILADLEQKAPLFAEQRDEYERALKSHQVLQQRLRESESARFSIQAELNAANVERRNHNSTINGFKAQSADLARQVALLLNEVNELKGCPPMPLPRNVAREDTDAQAVITSRLVDFTDIQSLQAKNQEMLFVIRELSEAQESRSSDAREEYEEKLQELKEQTSRQLEELANKRAQQENIVQAIVRQRDMYKTLYASVTSGGSGEGSEFNEHDDRNSELVAIGGGSGVAMMETNNELVSLNKELSHDLDKLKRESTERITALQRQVDEHREAAATARGQANAAKAAADFERQRFERLDEQYSASQREVNALTEKTSSLSRSNAAHEATLRAQGASLDSAEERVRSAQTQLARLEAERTMLVTEQKRLSEIVASAEVIKAKIEASRDAALSLSSGREEEHKRERERLTAEVNRLQQDYSRVRSELDIERERSRQQLAAHAAANSESAQRAAADVELSAKYKDHAAEAEKRADIAEAKLEMMESALARSEEKLRGAGRMASSSEPSIIAAGLPGGLTVAREQELLKAALKAGEAADVAKEAFEAEKKHTAQYKALAEQSDSALKEITNLFEIHKNESAKETAALKKECAQLKKDAADSAKSFEMKLSQYIKEAEVKVANSIKLESDLAAARADLERAIAATNAAEERASKAAKDVEDEHAKWREVQGQYEREVLARNSDAEKLATIENAKGEIEKALSHAKDATAKAERELVEAQAKEAKEKGQLESAKRAAESKVAELTKLNAMLHSLVENSKKETSDSKSGEEGEILRYLREEKESALAQVAALTIERNAFQREAELARQEAQSVRQRVQSTEAEAMGEEKHKSLLQKVEQLNAIEQTNSTLRAEIEAAKADIVSFKKRESELTATCTAAKEDLAKAKAAVEGHDVEVEALRKETKRWEERSQKLVEKYGEVDAAELMRIKAELEASTSELASTKEELKSETTRADKAKSQLAISLKHISAYNPEKTPLPQWRKARDEMEAKLAAFEAASKDASTGASELEAKLAEAKAEVETARANVKHAEEKASKAEKSSTELKAEVEKLREALKKAESAINDAPPATPAKVAEAIPEKALDAELEKTEDVVPSATPSSERFKIMLQKKQAELMETAKTLRETEEMLASKSTELAAALSEKDEAVAKCAATLKELDNVREHLRVTEAHKATFESKITSLEAQVSASTVVQPAATKAATEALLSSAAPVAPPMAELAFKSKDFVPSAKQQEIAKPGLSANTKVAEVDKNKMKKLEIQAQMELLRSKLEEKQAADKKRKADDGDAPIGEVPLKTQKTDAVTATASEATVMDKEEDVAEMEVREEVVTDDGELADEGEDDDENENDDAEEGELESDDDATTGAVDARGKTPTSANVRGGSQSAQGGRSGGGRSGGGRGGGGRSGGDRRGRKRRGGRQN